MQTITVSLKANNRNRLHWAEPVVLEVLVEQVAMQRVVRALDRLASPQLASATQLRAEAARQAMRVTEAMCNQQRMLFNDLPRQFHWA